MNYTLKAFAFLIAVSFPASLTRASEPRQRQPPQVFTLCASCHTVMKDGQQPKAPPLNNIVGREIASISDYSYSAALSAEQGVWTPKRLDNFLKRPNHSLPDTKMYFRGIQSVVKRAFLIKWLTENEVPLIIPPRSRKRETKDIDRAERAEQLFRPCIACHSFTQNSAKNIGPPLHNIVGRPVASVPNFDYSERLLMRGGIWNEKSLNVYFTEQTMFDKGSHIVFQTLSNADDRIILIELLTAISNQQ